LTSSGDSAKKRVVRRLLVGIFFAVSLGACTRPSVLVCEQVGEHGVCRGPTTTLDAGRRYSILATGFGMPTGQVTIRVSGGTSAHEVVATHTVQVASQAPRATTPILLPHAGRYRIDIVDEAGDVWKSSEIRVARPTPN